MAGWGTASAEAFARLGLRVETVPRGVRRFAFRSDRRERRALRAALAHLQYAMIR